MFFSIFFQILFQHSDFWYEKWLLPPKCEIFSHQSCFRPWIEVVMWADFFGKNMKISDFSGNSTILLCEKNICTGNVARLNVWSRNTFYTMMDYSFDAERIGAERVEIDENFFIKIFYNEMPTGRVEVIFPDYTDYTGCIIDGENEICVNEMEK